VIEAARAAAATIAASLDADRLPPLAGMRLKLRILAECTRCLRVGAPPPTPTETCDTCGATLRPAEFLRCDGCATAGVAS
jgi:hypothetical protein